MSKHAVPVAVSTGVARGRSTVRGGGGGGGGSGYLSAGSQASQASSRGSSIRYASIRYIFFGCPPVFYFRVIRSTCCWSVSGLLLFRWVREVDVRFSQPLRRCRQWGAKIEVTVTVRLDNSSRNNPRRKLSVQEIK